MWVFCFAARTRISQRVSYWPSSQKAILARFIKDTCAAPKLPYMQFLAITRRYSWRRRRQPLDEQLGLALDFIDFL